MRYAVGLGLVVALIFAGCSKDSSNPEAWGESLEKTKRGSDRAKIVEDLRRSGKMTPAFAPMLHQRLASEKQADAKAAVARALADLKDPSSVEPLSQALEPTGQGPANRELVIALGRIGDRAAIPTLLKVLKNKDAFMRVEAVGALGMLRAKEAVGPLTEMVKDENTEPFLTKRAIQALGDIGDPSPVPLLVKAMFQERKGVSFYGESSYSLFQMGRPAADALVPVVRGEDRDLVAWAKSNRVIEPALVAKSAQVLGDLKDTRAEKALIDKLSFNSEYLDIKLFVRMQVSNALGKMRSKDAVKPLSGMLNEEESPARDQYVRALVNIGGRDAVPAMVKSASTGGWDARESAVLGVALLGDEREQAALEKLVTTEPALTAKECKEDEGEGCDDPAALAKKHVEVIQGALAALEAGKACKADASCWGQKLADPNPLIRRRAALEVGRSGKGELADKLLERVVDEDLEARAAVIQGLDWLIDDNKDAAAKARARLPDLEKQLATEKGKTHFVKVNEDLRRLAFKLSRASA